MSEQNLEVEEVEPEEVIENEANEPSETVEAEAENDNVESGDDESQEESDTVVILEGDELEKEEAEPAPEWVKNVRKENKQLKRELKELKKSSDAETKEETPLRAKPKLEDFYSTDSDDPDKDYEADYEKWVDEKKAHEGNKAERQAELDAQADVWKARMTEYDEGKASFSPDSYKDAEMNVSDALDATRVGLIVDAFGGAAAKVVSYLGNNSDKLKELAGIKSLTQFTVAITRLEGKMTTQKRNKKPSPEKLIKGGSPLGSGGQTLKQLEKEAAQTGDYTKVFAYNKQNRA